MVKPLAPGLVSAIRSRTKRLRLRLTRSNWSNRNLVADSANWPSVEAMGPRTVYFCLLMLVGERVRLADAFEFAQVRDQAQALSQQPFAPTTNQIPSELLQLNYVQYQSIQFQPAQAL